MRQCLQDVRDLPKSPQYGLLVVSRRFLKRGKRGATFRLSKPISIEMTSFYSQQSDLVTRSPLSTPLTAQALVQGGLGRAYGTQFLLRHDLTSHFFGWLSYCGRCRIGLRRDRD